MATKHLLPLLLYTLTIHSAAATSYRTFPQRTSKEAAVVEWGHSAIISALDGAVATFGPQTSQGANFEVETGVVLADPIDGVGKGRYQPQHQADSKDGPQSDFERNYPGKLNNAAQVEGNMLIMTDAAGLSGVTMARIAKDSGAAALMVVNTDQKTGDFIYSLEPETEEEKEYADKHIDIPVIMVSLQAGNVITTATATDDSDPNEVNRGAALPERIRLYAGGDRPFFEDAMSSNPLVYLIHNMLTPEECDELLRMAEGKYEMVEDTKGVNNYLENSFASQGGSSSGGDAINVERTYLWKGAVAGKTVKDIDERMSQVMGFPAEHFSDFQVNKYVVGSKYNAHYDINDANGIMATITIFLNDVEEGGELVFSKPGDGGDPILISPKKGLAVVHHNTDENYNFDKSTVHEELVLKRGVKYVAKKFVYLNPQPTALRIVLPLLAMPFGGKLPKIVSTLQNALIEKFGYETADVYFQKIVTMIPVFLLVLMASAVSNFVSGKMKRESGAVDKKSSKKSGSSLESNGKTKAKSRSKKNN
ncbi:hypothetical protein ACHAWO_011811 [Cyclotella atomus]|uniref:Fe2OG dioxygenase domain-containing protein n=1 Tax=Cyclotella atomus TaxID=382360 RepID=A0ABD3NAS4_9STRA